MSDRVTYRSRPRVDSFFPAYYTGMAADLASSSGPSPFIGPFTEYQLMELFFRIKSIRVIISLVWEDFSDPPTETPVELDITMTRKVAWEEATSEIELLEAWHNGDGVYFSGSSGDWIAGIGANPYATTIDENGKLWVNGSWAMSHTGTEYPGTAWWYLDESAAMLPFSDGPSVKFKFGELMFRGGGYVTSLTATMDTTEYFPYKTTAGLPAWNTTTGAAANGGPGA